MTRKDRITLLYGASTTLLLFVGLNLFVWWAQGTGFWAYKIFAPKYAQAEYDTFKNSQAYNESMQQDLYNYQVQYNAAKDPDAKAVIADTIIHRANGYDTAKLPPSIASFISSLRAAYPGVH